MMRSDTYIDNIKCGGCANSITKKLEASTGITNVEVDVEEGKVSFEYKDDQGRTDAITALKKMGYPEKGQGNRIDNAKSFVSCMIGRLDK